MLFNPIRFKGIRVPGLAAINQLLPRKVQQIPGVMHGGIGWQGIIPSRAAKMGSISVDKTIAKIGSAGDFYDALDPEALDDLGAYQVLEAQPEVQEALNKAGRARTIRRSVHLTSFGRDFCETCLPLDTAGFLALKDEISGTQRA